MSVEQAKNLARIQVHARLKLENAIDEALAQAFMSDCHHVSQYKRDIKEAIDALLDASLDLDRAVKKLTPQ